MGDYTIVNGELYHHGVLGMKWGVRRYQHRDGRLTPAGKKRYAKEMEKLKEEEKKVKARERDKAKLDKLTAKKADLDARKKALDDANNKQIKKSSKSEKRSVKDMSDQELQAVVNRLNLEQRYSQLTPQKVSPGKKFVTSVFKSVVAPAATEVSRNFLKSVMTSSVEKKTGVKLSGSKKKDKDD